MWLDELIIEDAKIEKIYHITIPATNVGCKGNLGEGG